MTYNSTLDTLEAGEWSLHAILDNHLIPAESIGTRQDSATSWTVYAPEEDLSTETNYTETSVTELPVGAGCCAVDYAPLAFETGGAVWDLSKLRSGGFVAEVFTEAFVEITFESIEENTIKCFIPEGDILALLWWPICIVLDFLGNLIGLFFP